jgi:hypothetical protein
MRTLLCLFALLIGIVPTALAQDKPTGNEAPFGLTWGMSASEVKALGVELSDFPQSDWGHSFSATKLPKVLGDAEMVVLSFGFNDKLWRIAAVSRSFENDPAGVATMARYNELDKILADKYGKGTSVHPWTNTPNQTTF